MFKKSLILFLAAILVLLVLSGCLRKKAEDAGPVSLTFYGLDDSDVFDSLISKYRESHPNVRITYKKFNDSAEFEHLLVNEIAEGEGPDIFYIHNTWLPRHIKKIIPLQEEVLTPENYSEYYVNVTAEDFIQPDPKDGIRKIYALPLYVDTLALYYNKKIFERELPERGKPASTWEDMKNDASKLRIEDELDGTLKRGAIALGRSDNIRLATDILYNFFLQAGVDFYDSDFKQARFAAKGKEVFDFFLSFASPQNKNFSWSSSLVAPEQNLGEVEAFLSGKVASILAYSDLYPRIETELRNVSTRNTGVIDAKDVGVAAVPQFATSEADYKVWANYYGLAVSRNAKHPEAAWNFIRYLTLTDSARHFHNKTGRPTARRDMIEEQKAKPVLDTFVSQIGYAKSYRIFSDTRFAEILKEAIMNAAAGMTASQALGNAETAINDILKMEAPKGLYPKK